MDAESPSRLSVGHPPAGEEGAQAGCDVLRPAPTFDVVRERPEREYGNVGRGDEEYVVARTPNLDERWILPCRWVRPLDPCVDRQEGCPGHAVLQAGPRRTPEGGLAFRKPLVERT